MNKIISRKEAKSLGLKQYYSGKPCPEGHLNNRYTTNASCVTCTQKTSIKWKADNPEKMQELDAKRYQANPQKKLASSRTWKLNNPEKVLSYNKKWKSVNQERNRADALKWSKDNPEKKAASRSRYRALKLNATPYWSEKDKLQLIYSKAQEFGFDVDHIVPLKSPIVCGLHCWANLQLLDPILNRSKGNRTWPDMP